MTTHSVPKSMTRIHSEWKGIPVKYIAVTLTSAVVIAILAAVAVFAASILSKAVSVALILSIIVLWYKLTRTPKILEKSYLTLLFFLRSLRGETNIAKYSTTDTFLESKIPIRKFHPEGLIEFKDQKYGILMAYEPDRVSDDNLEAHIAKGQHLVDALHGELLIKMFVLNVPKRDMRPISAYINNIITTQTATQEQTQHLRSIYHQAQDNDHVDTDWKFYLFIGLGKHKTIQDATIAKQRYYDGFKSKIEALNIRIAQITNQQTLSDAFRECLI